MSEQAAPVDEKPVEPADLGAEGDSPEYLRQMAEKAGDSSVQDLNDEDDSLILGKFKDVDSLAEAYKNLESKLGQQSADQKPAEGEEPTKDQDSKDESSENQTLDLKREEPKEEAAKDQDDSTDIFKEYGQKYAENNGFTDEDYSALAEKGYPKEVVQVYEQGLRALQQSRTDAAVKAVGGDDQLKTVQQWAGQNLSDAELTAFNNQLNSAQSAEEVGVIYEALNARYRRSAGESDLVSAKGSTPKAAGYSNRQELVKAMSDPRYGTDEKYTKEVEQRVQYSDFL